AAPPARPSWGPCRRRASASRRRQVTKAWPHRREHNPKTATLAEGESATVSYRVPSRHLVRVFFIN
ncbi:hypothetical protein FOCC_FOCC005442, partial [Frankliniella occidentalis]